MPLCPRSSKQPLIRDNSLFNPDLQLRIVSGHPPQFACAAAVLLKGKVMLPPRAMGSIKGCAGSCRRSGVNRQQPQLRFRRVCFDCSAGARRARPFLPAPLLRTSPGRLPGGAGGSRHLSQTQGSAWLLKCSATQAHALSQPDVFPGPALHAEVPQCCWLRAGCGTG